MRLYIVHNFFTSPPLLAIVAASAKAGFIFLQWPHPEKRKPCLFTF